MTNRVADCFDHVYVVNLKHEAENRYKVVKHLQEHGIPFELFEAVNGYQGEPLERWKTYSAKPLGSLTRFPEFNSKEVRRGKHYIESAGAVGYIYTYISILEDAKRRQYKRILILEDDIILAKDFDQAFSRFIASVDPDWKVLQLGASQYGWGKVDVEGAQANGYYFPRRLATCGSFAIAIDHHVFDEVIEAESSFESPFDHITMGEIYEKYFGKCFVAYPNLIMPDVGTSSIRGERCQFQHGERMKWNVKNFEFPSFKVSLAVIVRSAAQGMALYQAVKRTELPVTLALYGLSTDGLRPLHNESHANLDDATVAYDPERHGAMPVYDFYAQVTFGGFLESSDVIAHLEHCLGLRSEGSPKLRNLEPRQLRAERGRISTIIPSYKRPGNLFRALSSVASQEYPNKEIIVVSDNGAESHFNQETLTVVNKVRATYPEVSIRYLEHSVNRNGAAARNTGLMHAKGEYITFLDDDDEYLPGRLSESVARLEAVNANIGAVYCGFLGWNSRENSPQRYLAGDLSEYIFTLEYKKHYLHTNTATYRRSYIDMINGFDESYQRHQDLEFNLRYLCISGFETVDQCLVRLNPEPSDVNNKVYGDKFLAIKQKFLTEFEWLIKSLDEPIQQRVYRAHWDELYRYAADKEETREAFRRSLNSEQLELFRRRDIGE
ncbi:glycosyltransferase [Marinimicrobium sp. ABcell2]|uniref:glycosyltransferase n=1 Tax=Marinimicrobium sp. ABcell2 TaxID=3069751 RepID=UPI0027B01CD2|nr:glycosyltransferase [Marinimicrobium sp. ABcell2]MDQ2078325.1 glycosyltransferase [Marinimicrobium sp. ABcell2]